MRPAYHMRQGQPLWQYKVSVQTQWSKKAKIVQILLDGCSKIPALGKQGQIHQLYQLNLHQQKNLNVVQSAARHCKRLNASNLSRILTRVILTPSRPCSAAVATISTSTCLYMMQDSTILPTSLNLCHRRLCIQKSDTAMLEVL